MTADPPREPRRGLTNVGGPVETRGEAESAAILGAAWRASEDAPTDALTHGFHSYPARFHPAVAAHLIAALSEPGQRVLDPFCGSGTVAVETMCAGREAYGSDLNPLAVRIADVHCALTDRAMRRRFVALLQAIAERSEEHVRARDSIRAPISKTEAGWYSGHVLRELAGLKHEIDQVPRGFEHMTLEVLFSAIVVKFSLQRSDTVLEKVDKRIRKGLPTEFYLRKGRELVERWAAFRVAVPPRTPPAHLAVGDARSQIFDRRLRMRLVLSSPPYGGTYDYAAHHARRYPWLGIRTGELDQHELGARRHFQRAEPGTALERWDRELLAALSSAAAQLERAGSVVWLLGDAQLAGRRVEADVQLQRLAPRAGLRLVASASQQRADYQGGKPRREHLLLLRHAR